MSNKGDGHFYRAYRVLFQSTIKVAVTFIFIFCSVLLSGCQTMAPVQHKTESREDVQEALSVVAGALSGKKLSEEELRDLVKQIRTDEDAQSAIQAITESVGGQAPVAKYCPVTGRRYAPHLEVCPEHNVELKTVDQ